MFVEALTMEFVNNEAVVCKQLLAMVKGLKSTADFDKDSVDSHELEVIGGNHRRVIMQKLLNKTKAERYKYTNAVLFSLAKYCAMTLRTDKHGEEVASLF